MEIWRLGTGVGVSALQSLFALLFGLLHFDSFLLLETIPMRILQPRISAWLACIRRTGAGFFLG